MSDLSPFGQSGDTVTEVTTKSWSSRLVGSLFGVLFGLLMVPGAVWLLAWNEGRAVHTARSLAEGAGIVLSVPAERVDPANEGKLVHVAGLLAVPGSLSDPEFEVQVTGATQLRRRVEMYQWREEQHSETRSKLGGGQETVTTYNYVRVWSESPIDSSRFRNSGGHGNPPMRHRGLTRVAETAQLGAFRLDQAQLGRLGEFQPVPSDAVPLREGARPIEGGLYLGGDPGAPRIGDLRITWSAARTDSASVIGQQSRGGFIPYQARAGDRLLLVSNGAVPAAQMIERAELDNAILTWALRAAGAAVIFLGMLLLLSPLVVLADVVPIFGSIIGFGSALIALLFTVLLAPLAIGLAWLWYRPLAGGLILALGAALVFGVLRLMQRRRAARQATLPPAGMAPPQPPVPGQASSFFPAGWKPPR